MMQLDVEFDWQTAQEITIIPTQTLNFLRDPDNLKPQTMGKLDPSKLISNIRMQLLPAENVEQAPTKA